MARTVSVVCLCKMLPEIALLISISFGMTHADVCSSMHRLLQYARVEEEMFTILQEYVNLENKELNRIVTEELGIFAVTTPEARRQMMVHPNSGFDLIARFPDVWMVLGKILPAFWSRIDRMSQALPKPTDLNYALTALIRIQYFYRLNAIDMYRGDYLGYHGPALSTSAAVHLGNHAFHAGYVELSRDWLQLAAEKLSVAARTSKPVDRGLAEHGHFIALLMLCRAHLTMNDTSTARKACGNKNFYNRLPRYLQSSQHVQQMEQALKGGENTFVDTYQSSKFEFDPATSDLCLRHKGKRLATVHPHHVCRYKPALHCPFQRYKEEILSVVPYVSLFYDVINDWEIKRLKEMSSSEMKIADKLYTQQVRVSEQAWVYDKQDPVVARLSQKVEAITGLDTSNSIEDFNVQNYGLGGHYHQHEDSPYGPMKTGPYEKTYETSMRLATFIFYMTDVERGGFTVFSKLGISVAPAKGMALFWYNFEPDLEERRDAIGYGSTTHGGCPVVVGNKWIATRWIHPHMNLFRRPCGITPNATQLDVERVVRSRFDVMRSAVSGRAE